MRTRSNLSPVLGVPARSALRKSSKKSTPSVLPGYANALSAGAIRELEGRAMRGGMPERALVENAAAAVVEVIIEYRLLKKAGDRVAVIAGYGNNGADALVVARDLCARGYAVRVFILDFDNKKNALVREMIRSLKSFGVPLYECTPQTLHRLFTACEKSRLIIDGIFGIGFHGVVPDIYARIFRKVNALTKRRSARLLAIDIPSGVSADNGRSNEAIRADYTVTFFAEKKGFYVSHTRAWCGTIIVKDTGVSREMIEGLPLKKIENRR